MGQTEENNVDTSNTEENIEVDSLANYLKALGKKIGNHKKKLVVYRGEPQVYPKPCRANIFRQNKLSNNYCFERNLFDAMRQQGITKEIKYLYNAIDAQHGEFPSRLLDVTYNCMTALYFAVTGFYKKGDDCEDSNDGMVYVFFIDDIYSPSAINTNEAYETIINRDKKWFTDQILFEKNHKFIDHGKLNQRVIAQQGAFILFQGNDATPIPEYMMESIRIPHNAKKKLREELKLYFGIHTGSIYPELTNLVTEMTNKSKMINSEKFDFETEIDLFFNTFKKEMNFYSEELAKYADKRDEKFLRRCEKLEEVCKSYSDSIVDYNPKYDCEKFEESKETEELKEKKRVTDRLKKLKKEYNDFLDELMENYIDNGILDENKIEKNETELNLFKFKFK